MTASVGLLLAQRGGLRSGDIAGTDTVALDVVLSIFGADVAGEHLKSALCSCISGNGLTAELTHHRADIDNLAFLALHHLRQNSRRADERGHKVDIDNLLEFLALHLVHRDTLDDTGIVDENVNLTDLFMNGLYESLYGNLIGNVADITLDVGDAGLFVIIKTALKGSLVDVVENDVLDACSHKSLGNVETDTVGSSGNPGVLAFKRENVCHNRYVLSD